METEQIIIEKIPLEENTEIHVVKVRNGYNVLVFDLDEEEYLPTGRIFASLEQALRYAKDECVTSITFRGIWTNKH